MAGKKRSSEFALASATQRKRVRVSDTPATENKPVNSVLHAEEVDFPRGGGTSFTPLEYKTIRAEALKELKDEIIFKEADAKGKHSRKEKRSKVATSTSKRGSGMQAVQKSKSIRVEHLNYKRVTPGMKLLCQIVAVYPFSAVVSLPGQLLGHIPITHVSSQLTPLLKAADEDNASNPESDIDGDDENQESKLPPDMTDLFRSGQYVRAVVSAVKPPGTTEGRTFTYAKDVVEKASRRVELSLVPEKINAGLLKADLKRGFTMTAAVKSIEDHGYILEFGVPDVSGFLPYKKGNQAGERRRLGSLVDVVVDRLGEDGRTCIFTAEQDVFKSSSLKEITNLSSLVPGAFVQALITAVVPTGLVLQIFGSFKGTVDLYHLPSGSSPADYKIGKKVKARVLYDVTGTNPRQFALSLAEHIVSLDTKKGSDGQPIQEAYPIGTVLQSVKVDRVESERGLVVLVGDGVEGFVHISHASDEHIPSLSANSGPWKVGTLHQARIIGHHPLEGILQISFRPSVLGQKFLRVDDVHVGEVVKGTVKKLTDSTLFVSINGSVDAMVWPKHYADIMLKHPQKRFKAGGNVKARVLSVDPERKRILLTAKKTLVESDLPIVASFDDVEAGLVTHGVVGKVHDKVLVVEFYNNIRAIVPASEASEIPLTNLSESFPVGKPVKVRILSIDREATRIVASICQASSDLKSTLGDIKSVEVGQTVSGEVAEVHHENALLILDTSRARALISMSNVANHRGSTVEKLRTSLRAGNRMDELVVVSRNLDKGIVIVANRPSHSSKYKQAAMSLAELEVGAKVEGLVVKHGRHGAIVKFPGRITGLLHPTDTCDDYEQGDPFPITNSAVHGVVIAVDRAKKHVALSTRLSRLNPDVRHEIVDKEIDNLNNIRVGQNIRGFIKSVAEHGIFVTLSRSVDARVQIKELYDEFVKDWKGGFKANQLVSGRVLKVDLDKKQIEMTFRSEQSSSHSKSRVAYSDLVEGQKIDGKVKKIEDFGLFIDIEGTKVTGLCHKSEIADSKDADISMALRNFREGDTVKAIVLSVDHEKRRISLGLKPSYFDKGDLESNDDMNVQEDDTIGEQSSLLVPDDSLDADIDIEEEEDVDFDEDNEAMVVDLSVLRSQVHSAPEPSKGHITAQIAPVLSLRGGFQWSDTDERMKTDESSSSEGESDSQAEKKRKKKKVIEEDLTAEMHTKIPESVSDFERHLLASPNSSFLWIQYMSFQLQLSEIEKAREIGKRALRVISIREEQEKLNVWIALLNLENTYGTDESLEALFKDAARHNDSKTVHLRLAAIFDQSEKFEKAEEQYKRTCKKFGQSSKVWTLFGEHYLRRNQIEDARKLLPRSLQSLEKRKHLKTISKFAQLEYKLGDPERGKTLFEGIIDSHPKRWDLWSIYMDMEAGQKDIQGIRNLFDRVLTLKMTSHKAKSFFKKWLELERRIGDEDGERVVKEKAMEWTQRTVSAK